MSVRPAAFCIPGDLNTVTGGYIYERRLLEELRAQGRDMLYLPLPDGFPDPSPQALAKAVAAMAEVPAERPLIVDGLVFGSVPPEALARVRGPVVGMVHHPLALEEGLAPDRARMLHEREKANCALAAHIVVPSPHTARVLVADYGVPEGRITVALPGIEAPARTRTPVDPPLILSVGILHPRKGHDVLIAALRRIADLDWQAVIVGAAWDGGHAEMLRRLAAESGLGERLRMPGLLPQDAVSALWGQATVFALATRYEGYGIVFAEALACGLPIVGTKVGAVPETVPPDCGLLVPPDDARALAEALRRVLTDEVLRERLGRAATLAGGELTGWSDTAAAMGRVLDTV